MSLPHHVSREGTPRERGWAFGAACAGAVDLTVRTYRRLLREAAGVAGAELRAAGAAVGEQLGRRCPEVLEELEGIAAGARQDVDELLAVNARTELLAGAHGTECSVVGQVKGERVTLAQTWDWHPELAPARVLWTVVLAEGGWLVTATEAGIVAKLGLNGRGVACALNFLSCSTDGGTDGIPIHVLLRLLLERCGSADEALRLLVEAETSGSSAITVAAGRDDVPALFTVELSPGGARVVHAEPDGWLVHTNHFLAPPLRGVDLEPGWGPGSELRRDRLGELVRGGVLPRAALASHEPAIEPICRHAGDIDEDVWADRRVTLLALDLDPVTPAFGLATGPPCDCQFETVALP